MAVRAPYDPLPIRVRADARFDGGVTRWLADPDGDALLRLAEDGFDFSKPGLVEFSVEFRSWPPAPRRDGVSLEGLPQRDGLCNG
jgi:hypothetical protein